MSWMENYVVVVVVVVVAAAAVQWVQCTIKSSISSTCSLFLSVSCIKSQYLNNIEQMNK